MAYDPQVVNAIRRVAKQRGVPDRWLVSAFATGIVESGLRNLGGGDADSAGWRQERGSIYPNPTNLMASVNRYFDELGQHDKGQSIGELSADVQRPAAQYRSRYADVLDQAQALAGGKNLNLGGAIGSPSMGSQSPAAASPNIFATLAGLNQDNPQLQQGWNLLAQLQAQRDGAGATSSGAPAGTSLPSLGNTPVHGDLLAKLARMATKRGLAVREYEPYDPVDPVHVEGSLHDDNRAFDTSGDPNTLSDFYSDVTKKYGRQLGEAFYDPIGYYVKRGKRTRGAIGGHKDHAHFGVY
jgi:hypothetical protein